MSVENNVANKAEEVVGQAKEAAGAALGDENLQAEGQADQAASKLKQGLDDVAEKVKHTVEDAAEKVKEAVESVKEKITGD
ncbi:CsbD family protein [Mycobacteroides immunogenum]|uniref:CsbD-like domain-containing protein n=1 Tax=Mycobacteroides immunogenum TaxID=83262 RepID=A0A7V8LLC1_9MYCO|nr:CsbD family protein [Mycobacteroides immunogenum]AMT70597.1 hypothetical protein ABG82_10040 [Mycobacteroides immunogenum]KPG04548.1 hypothetical protein AN909_22535 [Mycobacteroides immunogenum]KPG05312.1 hypothetical protein AN908_23045 [Mycobacteroides immunogenum]KPG06136.1 hypothetical protein AN910_22275 [Mycobacteroides immunogenum]KPG19398.1 hypothetical protein AN911_23100 [Mycobacteroides immunogenum]